MKQTTGMKLLVKKEADFASRVAVYQASLFDSDRQDFPQTGRKLLDTRPIAELNALITAQYDMTQYERAIFVETLKGLPEEGKGLKEVFSITLDARPIIAQSSLSGEKAVAELEKATASLLRHVCWIENEEGRLQVSLISCAQYVKGKGLIRLHIDPSLLPHLQAIKKLMGSEKVSKLLEFKSFYSKCFYELFSTLKGTRKSIYYSLLELKTMLRIKDGEYERYNDLKRFVLLRAQESLENTDGAFSFEEHRIESGKVAGVTFYL